MSSIYDFSKTINDLRKEKKNKMSMNKKVHIKNQSYLKMKVGKDNWTSIANLLLLCGYIPLGEYFSQYFSIASSLYRSTNISLSKFET